jgi:hypothetical protein
MINLQLIFPYKPLFSETINIIYLIEPNKEPIIKYFKKPLDICIYKVYKDRVTILEEKRFFRMRRRIFHTISNINKLQDGKIKQYQVFNRLELEVLKKYLTDKNYTFRLVSNERIYNKNDTSSYTYDFRCNSEYPEYNHVLKNVKLYIKVYKGYVDLTEAKSYTDALENKYKIWLNNNLFNKKKN